MFDCKLDLELHFSNLASFFTMLFDTKTVNVCTIHIGQPKIRDGDHFPIFEVLGFLFLRYWGLHHNWDMHNAFVFDGRHGVKAYLRKLKGVLMWQFSLLEQVKILSLVECSSCLLVIQHVPLPM